MARLVEMRFLSSLHAGEAGLGLEEVSLLIHSDTLYSALSHSWLQLYGEPVPEDVVLSSAFPFLGGTYFFPRPMLPAPGFTAEARFEFGKALKRLRFVAKKHFADWINGRALEFRDMLAESERLEAAVRTRTRPAVTLDRQSNASGLYFVGEAVFDRAQDAGLFALVNAEADRWPALEAAFTLLGEEGIGGRRSSGFGRFTCRFADGFDPGGAEGPNAYVSLSLVYPNGPAETKGNLIAYRLVERTGWVEAPGVNYGERHRRVLMFAEGSVFKRPCTGKLVDVAPPGFGRHPVWRNGLAFNVGARLLEVEYGEEL